MARPTPTPGPRTPTTPRTSRSSRRALLLPILALLAACGSKAPFGDACQPGSARCDRNAYQLCSDDGNFWKTVDDCAPVNKTCVAQMGCRNCSPGSLLCGGDGFDIVLCRPAGDALDRVARCEPESGVICGGGSCRNACDVAATTRSYEGCDYWAVDLDNAVTANQGPAAAQQFAVVVTNPLEVPATVVVEVNDAPVGQPPVIRQVAEVHLARIPFSGDLAVINLDAREVDGTSDPRLNDGPGTFLSSNAYHIRSTAPIIAYQFNPLGNVPAVYSNDASLLLPSSALDTRYDVLSWPQTLAKTNDGNTNANINLRAFLTIVGMDAPTNITVRLSTPTIPGGGIPEGKLGDTLRFTIGPYDVVNLETGSFNADFTGTLVRADKPIAVFTGSEASDVPFFTTTAVRECCADHLEEQLFPTSAFGTEFVAVKSPQRTAYLREAGMKVPLVDDEADFWRILSVRDGTEIKTSLTPPSNRFFLNAGQFVTFSTDRDFVVEASAPISFAQFPVSQQSIFGSQGIVDGVRVPGGDPSSIMIPPLQQWRDKYVFLTPNKYTFDSVMIAMPATSTLLFDGEELSTALPRCDYRSAGKLRIGDSIEETEFVGIRCPLSDPEVADLYNLIYQNDGRHVLESVDGQRFGLTVFGFDSYVSYGYPAGTDVRAINIEQEN